MKSNMMYTAFFTLVVFVAQGTLQAQVSFGQSEKINGQWGVSIIRGIKIMKRLLLLVCIGCYCLPGVARQLRYSQDVELTCLKVEYAETPIGIDVVSPRFSWQMVSSENRRGCSQAAYRLVVTSETGEKVWDSKKTKSSVSLNIEYAGKPLSAATRYNWALTVWDDSNQSHTAQSWFETGLMNTSLSAWDGAKWTGTGNNDLPLYSQYLSVFSLNYTIRLDEAAHSTHAAFVYGANDDRLTDKNKNLFHLENGKNESYISVELDIAPLLSGENARLNIYRAGYKPEDRKDTPYESYPVPQTIIHDGNKYEAHVISLSSVFGNTRIHIDGNAEENLIAALNLNPVGRGGNFTVFPVLADIGFSVAAGQTATFSKVEIRNFRSPANVLASWISEEKLSDTFRVFDPSRNSMPELQTTFNISRDRIAKARLYITARGIYEAYLNGKRIGSDYFNPGLTQYNKTHLYQTYDVTDCIRTGENTLGALLGEGWWSGNVTYSGENWNFFGDRQSLLAKLVVTYPDGTADVTVSNPSTWVYSTDNPTVYGSFFQGEVYDATGEAQPKRWKPAEEVALEGTAYHPLDNYLSMTLTGQFGQTVKQVRELTARSVEEVRPGVFVYDMGQNMVGVPQIRLSGMKAGRKIVLRYAEVKYPDLPEYSGNAGMIMLENIRAAMAQDIYITRGGEETISPRFTFHGYRFIEITGIDKPLPPEAVKGRVLSSIDNLSSHYETSDSRINRLWENITWSIFGNFLSIPTDCPQRNERMGWSGDISVFSRTASYLANIPQFLRRHLLAMRDVQGQDGRFPDVAPLGGGFGGILWGSAGITVAWESYQQFGDRQMLTEHYPAMKDYMEYLILKINPQSGILKEKDLGTGAILGDWLCPKDVKNEKALLWESYFIYDLELMSKAAAVLNKNNDAERFKQLCAERKTFFNKNYIDASTGKTVFKGDAIDTQSSYALAFAFNIINEKHRETALENFTASITRENRSNDGTVCPPYSLMTGFIGTAWISRALADNGYADMAYRLLQQTTYPSWLYPVEQGATTIWERLNSYTHTNGFGGNNGMNSFNHYSFGAVGAWMYSHSLGIERDENSPGFKHFILQPHPDTSGGMTFAKGHYDSMYGRIESGWTIENDGCRYRFAVPANTSATLYLKTPSAHAVVEGKKPFASAQGVKYVGEKDGKHVFELLSGNYDIQVKGSDSRTIE
jgi:alpha-L-rhamnosidase